MYVEILILGMLQHGSRHGYELKKQAECSMGHKFAINNNTLYPVLKRLEKTGNVVKSVKVQAGRPNRHVYVITPRGRARLRELLRGFSPELAVNDNEFYARMMLLDQLPVESQRYVLATRKTVLAASLEFLRDHGIRHAEKIKKAPMPGSMLAFMAAKLRHEMNWITKLQKEC